MHRYGLGIAPEKSPSIWGARGIFGPHYIDVPWDRTTLIGSDEILKLLNNGRWQAAQLRFAEMVSLWEIEPDKQKIVVLYEDERVKIVGDSRSSYGYFYVDAWLKPLK